jgi:hypothetical protein
MLLALRSLIPLFLEILGIIITTFATRAIRKMTYQSLYVVQRKLV